MKTKRTVLKKNRRAIRSAESNEYADLVAKAELRLRGGSSSATPESQA